VKGYSLGYSVSSVVILFVEREEKIVWVLTLQFSWVGYEENLENSDIFATLLFVGG